MFSRLVVYQRIFWNLTIQDFFASVNSSLNDQWIWKLLGMRPEHIHKHCDYLNLIFLQTSDN